MIIKALKLPQTQGLLICMHWSKHILSSAERFPGAWRCAHSREKRASSDWRRAAVSTLVRWAKKITILNEGWSCSQRVKRERERVCRAIFSNKCHMEVPYVFCLLAKFVPCQFVCACVWRGGLFKMAKPKDWKIIHHIEANEAWDVKAKLRQLQIGRTLTHRKKKIGTVCINFVYMLIYLHRCANLEIAPAISSP